MNHAMDQIIVNVDFPLLLVVRPSDCNLRAWVRRNEVFIAVATILDVTVLAEMYDILSA